MPNDREHIPAGTPRNRKHPLGWVRLPVGSNPKMHLFTESFLNTRMPRTNTIGMNQHYIENVMDNPKTSIENKRIAYQYVIDHPERFTALCDRTDSQEVNEWARKRNGTAGFGWIRMSKDKYGWYRP